MTAIQRNGTWDEYSSHGSSVPSPRTVKQWPQAPAIRPSSSGMPDRPRHQTLKGHTSSVGSAAFSPNGQTMVSGSGDKTIKLWDAKTRLERQTLDERKDNCIPTSHTCVPQISLVNHWVIVGGQKALWLPSEYRH
ncbi:WD40 repeat domain-containing protein [Aspergillus tanneri]|uniref:Mitochondrial division protein 1 n=1 Tax=Aspergillus tanneri TaxID=1220188 RepID=A0A5M9MWH0_9EURO|nr:uncharacterized protein ATNIH1004_000338 [Aspergillus tanneri]KAA8651455.1 hypothetical protein ATNIH1004_000338 [Aspergillus tanneri]